MKLPKHRTPLWGPLHITASASFSFIYLSATCRRPHAFRHHVTTKSDVLLLTRPFFYLYSRSDNGNGIFGEWDCTFKLSSSFYFIFPEGVCITMQVVKPLWVLKYQTLLGKALHYHWFLDLDSERFINPINSFK